MPSWMTLSHNSRRGRVNSSVATPGGISVENSADVVLEHNLCTGKLVGIGLYSNSTGRAVGNECLGNDASLLIAPWTDFYLEDNWLHDNLDDLVDERV
jgi:parallel beta-helix repeat protein